MIRCRIYRSKEGEEYLVHQCVGCIAGDEIQYMEAREYKKRFCTCEVPENPRQTKRTVLQKNGKRLSTTKKVHAKKQWDETPPTSQYFKELFRVSKNQIIWGINYFDIPNIGPGRLRWNKGVAEGVSFKKYEYAYCSLIENTIDIDLLWAGFCQAKSVAHPLTQQGNKKLNEKRIHPTQKPVLLYKKLLMQYAQPGYKILDTHLGSMSIAVACQDMNFDLTGSEIDREYYNDGIKRI